MVWKWIKATLKNPVGVVGWGVALARPIYNVIDFLGNAQFVVDNVHWPTLPPNWWHVFVPTKWPTGLDTIVGFAIVIIVGYVQSRRSAGTTDRAPALGLFGPNVPSAGVGILDSPDEIMDRVNAAAPFDQPRVRANYSGMVVEWHCQFRSVTQMSDFWTVYVSPQRASDSAARFRIGPMIYFQVADLSKYPFLRVLLADAPLLIRGTIRRVLMNDIELQEDEQLRIAPQ